MKMCQMLDFNMCCYCYSTVENLQNGKQIQLSVVRCTFSCYVISVRCALIKCGDHGQCRKISLVLTCRMHTDLWDEFVHYSLIVTHMDSSHTQFL